MKNLTRRRPPGTAEGPKITKNKPFSGGSDFFEKFDSPKAAGYCRRPKNRKKHTLFTRGMHFSKNRLAEGRLGTTPSIFQKIDPPEAAWVLTPNCLGPHGTPWREGMGRRGRLTAWGAAAYKYFHTKSRAHGRVDGKCEAPDRPTNKPTYPSTN